MWIPFEEKERFREVVIKCGKDGCEGVFKHKSWIGDLSPRIEEKCTVCDNSISRKLGNIDEDRIVSHKIVEE